MSDLPGNRTPKRFRACTAEENHMETRTAEFPVTTRGFADTKEGAIRMCNHWVGRGAKHALVFDSETPGGPVWSWNWDDHRKKAGAS